MNIWRNESLKQRIYAQLLREIVKKEIAPGTPLPSCAALAERFHAGRETVKAVIARLAETGYIIRRNRRVPLAALKLPRRHYTIAIPFADYPGHLLKDYSYDASPWNWMLYRALSEALSRHGHQAVLFNYRQGNEVSFQSLHGAIAIASARIRDFAEQAGLPTVSVLNNCSGKPGNIELDRSEAMMQCATYFLAHGVRSVAAMSFYRPYRSAMVDYMEQYFRQTLLDNGLAPEWFVEYADTKDTSEESGRTFLKDFLSRNPPRPFGILTSGDYQAAGAIRAATAAGLIPKKDFVAVGTTGLKEVEHWTPRLSTAGTPFEEVGECAAAAIMEYIATGVKPAPVFVKSKLVIRDT